MLIFTKAFGGSMSLGPDIGHLTVIQQYVDSLCQQLSQRQAQIDYFYDLG